MNNYREINTLFFSKKADEILRSVLGQLSDGLWENIRGYTKYWVNFNVERRANEHLLSLGLGVWEVRGSHSNPLFPS